MMHVENEWWRVVRSNRRNTVDQIAEKFYSGFNRNKSENIEQHSFWHRKKEHAVISMYNLYTACILHNAISNDSWAQMNVFTTWSAVFHYEQ